MLIWPCIMALCTAQPEQNLADITCKISHWVPERFADFLFWLMVPVCKHALRAAAACIEKAKIIEYHMIYVASRTIRLGNLNNWSNCWHELERA